VNTFDWADAGVSLEIGAAIGRGDPFSVKLPRWASALIPASVAAIDPLTIGLVTALVALAAFAGLAGLAITKGYKITRRTSDGEEWVFEPPK
jgi:hypothetical protein